MGNPIHLYLLWVLLLFTTLIVEPVAAQRPIDPNQNLDLIWEQITSQPQDVAIACMPLNDRSRTVLYNPSELFPLASVTKVLIYIEYARRLELGLIPLDETVSVEVLNRYNLPRTDRGAHDDFMADYRAGRNAMPLLEIASIGMMRYSSNAAADYLLERMAPIDWATLYTTLNVTRSSPPYPFLSIPLLMNNHQTGEASLDTVPTLSVDLGLSLTSAYLNNPSWREEEISYRSQFRTAFPAWEVQSAVLQQHTATGTVYDYLTLMATIYGTSGTLPANVRTRVRDALRWRNYSNIDATYSEYGSKLGTYSGGTLTLVAYGQPYNSGAVVSVVFLRNIPRDTFRTLTREDQIGDMAHWMNLNTCAGITARLSGA
jgi:D-alanyl-D-alanine carboxypeptidase